MFNLAVDFSMLSSSVHVTAFVLGAIVYLSYTFWPTLWQIAQPLFQNGFEVLRPKAADESTPCRQLSMVEKLLSTLRQMSAPRRAAAGGAVVALLIGLALSVQSALVQQRDDPACALDIEAMDAPLATVQSPVPASERWRGGAEGAENSNLRLKLRSPGAWKYFGRAAAPNHPTESPTELLARAHADSDPSSISDNWSLLEACATWASPSGVAAPASELLAQLECNGELLESGATTHEAAASLLSRARGITEVLRAQEDSAPAAWRSAQVEWARITHGVFQLTCKAITDEMQLSRKSKASAADQQARGFSTTNPLAGLRSLKRLEVPFQETLDAVTKGIKVLESSDPELHANITGEVEELANALGADRACALHALTEGRNLALVLPRNQPLVRKALQCQPRMLEDFQALVLKEAAEAKDGATLFALGLYYSDAGLAAEQGQQRAPFFGTGSQTSNSRWKSEPNWASDAGGAHAPTEIVEAEKLMKAAEEASSGADRSDRGAARALRLYQHAKMLALKHHDSAAEWRYRTASELAATYRRQKLASHALGRLGYFLSLRGRKPEALEAAGSALEHGEEDPLAQYLQASLRRTLGELKTDEEVIVAEKQMASVAGKLPSKTLEDQRAAAHQEMQWWGLVAKDGLRVCLKAWDAAQMLICLLMGLAFKLPELA